MSKVRVFELAKELNISSQDLVGRAKEASIRGVDNHLSQLDSDAVEKVRRLFATPHEGDVIEQRVTNTVIRRKRVRADEGPAEAAPEPVRTRAEDGPVRRVAVSAAAPASPPPAAEPEIALPPPIPQPVALEQRPAEHAGAEESPPVEAIAGADQMQPEPAPPQPVPTGVLAQEAIAAEPLVLAELAETPAVAAQGVSDPPTVPVAAESELPVEIPLTVEAAGSGVEAPAPRPPETRPIGRTSVTPSQDTGGPRMVRGVRVDPHGRPTETRAVVVAAPPVDFRPSMPSGPGRSFSGPPRSGQGTGAGPGSGSPPPRRPDDRVGPPAPFGAPTDVRGVPLTDRERAEKDDKKAKKRTGRVVVEKGKGVAGAWNPRRVAGEEDLVPRLGRRGKKGPKKSKTGKTLLTTPRAAKRVVRIEDTITVGDLAQALSIKGSELIRALIKQGVMATINHVLDFETASIIAEEFEYKVENVGFDIADYIPDVDEDETNQLTRSPVVTVMGHVDHGKTSLLDYIRKSRVASQEAGGITQHIGAYSVEVKDRRVVFLDTPGHEAFTEMRARGAQVTDIVILVVAADDGVMPQTIEAMHHAKAAEVPIVVAITKIDKHNARPDRVMQQLSEHDLQPVQWGGSTEVIQVSSHTGDGIEELLELLALQADVLELTANPDRPAQGVVIEARLDRGRGPVASVIIQNGTLRVGDHVVTGQYFGRVRALMDDSGKNTIREAGPSTPVQILGLNGVPSASDPIIAVEDEKKARTIAEHRATKEREKELGKASGRISLEDLYEQIRTGETQELRVIVKADVHGSVEALKGALAGTKHSLVQVKIIHDAVGGITEGDVNLAKASNAIIIGFNVRAVTQAKQLAEQEGVEIKTYSVIYDMVDDVKKAMEGLLAPTIEERELGRAEVRQTFSVPKIGVVAGCYITSGLIRRNARVRLFRDNVLVWTGGLGSLRRFKSDVREVSDGYECGIRLDGFNDVKEGDIIEAFETVEVAQTLE